MAGSVDVDKGYAARHVLSRAAMIEDDRQATAGFSTAVPKERGNTITFIGNFHALEYVGLEAYYLRPLHAAMKAEKIFRWLSRCGASTSGCHWTPRANWWRVLSIPSMTPSSATAFTIKHLPRSLTAW